MTGDAKKFLEFASKDETIKKELMAAKGADKALEVVRAHGFELTSEDFAPLPQEMEEMTEDELKAVAGGVGACVCGVCGAGAGDGLVCACFLAGFGIGPDGKFGFCFCSVAGGGGQE